MNKGIKNVDRLKDLVNRHNKLIHEIVFVLLLVILMMIYLI